MTANPAARPEKDRPWVMRTYAGHSSATESNKLYRMNLAKGQTGLSVAFDLPTQTGYDPDSPLSRGEVGKVGVPIPHLGEMRRLFADIPLTGMNTSMTINATAMWLLALYQVVAEEQNPELEPLEVAHQLAGTTQNDIIKEYLSRGTYVFPPEHSLRLISDVISYTVNEIPKWNPINICSYHLQEAGATPTQELAYALCTAIAVLDAVKDAGQISEDDFGKVVGRISFFVNAGVRFVEETCKMRAFVRLWDEITRERYGVTDEKMRRFRYGVQVNSLGLTEAQPENNVQRIVLEMLGVTLSKNARARAVQLPAWNEALGLPRPWDQQWSLRFQQVLAFESDLLEYDDIFEGSKVIEAKVDQMGGVQRGVGVLEDHLHLAPVGGASARRPRPGDLIALEADRPRGRLGQVEDRPAGRGLAGARTRRPAPRSRPLGHREADSVHGLHPVDLAVDQDAALYREVLDQVAHLEQGSLGARCEGASNPLARRPGASGSSSPRCPASSGRSARAPRSVSASSGGSSVQGVELVRAAGPERAARRADPGARAGRRRSGPGAAPRRSRRVSEPISPRVYWCCGKNTSASRAVLDRPARRT